MASAITITRRGAEAVLSFECGNLPAEDGIIAADHEPNGYFWESLAAWVSPDIVSRLALDSEAGMFSASGDPADIEALGAKLAPIVEDPDLAEELIREAEDEGFEFDD